MHGPASGPAAVQEIGATNISLGRGRSFQSHLQLMSTKIGMIGTGAMGAGMAANLRKKGFDVAFHSRDTERARATAERLRSVGARPVRELPALARDSEVIIVCLPDSPSVEG